VHAKGKPFDDTVDLSTLARATPGFTGADLANLLNEGALLAARRKRDTISMDELQEAIERVIAGPQRPSRLMRENERRIVAFHEAGHALVGYALPNTDPVHKVTIIPRGQALGFTMQLPTDDKVLTARSELIDRLAVMMGGRVAEEIIVGDFTTGAGDDIRRATDTAKQMVTQFGMSLKLGPMTFGQQDHQPFLGRDYGHQADYSASIAAEIDTEVRLLLDEAHDEALEILVGNRGVLEALAERLLEIETVDRDGLEELFKSVVKRPSRALHAPDVAVAPAAVVQAMRRLAPGNGIAAMRSESGDHT
jgi:cell division protease FtsH